MNRLYLRFSPICSDCYLLKVIVFIHIQGPKKDTTVAFWAMVMQSDSTCIVCLTNLQEKDTAGRMRPKCVKYWPDAGKPLKLTKYFVIKNEGEVNKGPYVVRNINCIQRGELVAHFN